MGCLDVIYYGELDPYSGSVRAHPYEFQRLVYELKLNLLFAKSVILPTENMIHHPLALPAFEALEPFVRVGLLGTSTQNPREAKYSFLNRMDRIASEMYIKGNKHIKAIRQRWEYILPNRWGLQRNIGAQMEGGLEIIKQLLFDDGPVNERKSGTGKNIISIINNHHELPDRTDLMEIAAAHSDLLSSAELYRFKLFIQNAYYRMGGVQKFTLDNKLVSIKHFPGGFYRNHESFIRSIDPSIAPGYVAQLSNQPLFMKVDSLLGCSLKSILSLSAEILCQLKTHDDWDYIAEQILYRENLESLTDTSAVIAIQEFLRDVSLKNKQEARFSVESGDYIAMPFPVLNAIKSYSGFSESSNITASDEQEQTIIYNHKSSSLSYNGEEYVLHASLIPQMNLLLAKGRTGIMPIEFNFLEFIKPLKDGSELSRRVRFTQLDKSHRDNAKQKRKKLRELLGKFGISIRRNSKTLWVLEGPEIVEVAKPVFNIKVAESIPSGKKKMTIVFNILASSFGIKVPYKHLEQELEKQRYVTSKSDPVSKTIYLINTYLAQQKSEYYVNTRPSGYATLVKVKRNEYPISKE